MELYTVALPVVAAHPTHVVSLSAEVTGEMIRPDPVYDTSGDYSNAKR